ncbi:hypothetical protein ABZ874_27475 [Streptomyces albidoflavus]|uniref:hypothetical protein n=1 Tax=Streptomyces albidoflavus TaxID=1886 RepID=UPI0033D3BA6C
MTTTPRTARHLLRVREASLILGAVLVSGFGSSATALVAGVNGASLYAVVDAGLGRAPSWAGVLYAVQGAGSVATGLAAGTLMRRLGERGFAAGGCPLRAGRRGAGAAGRRPGAGREPADRRGGGASVRGKRRKFRVGKGTAKRGRSFLQA